MARDELTGRTQVVLGAALLVLCVASIAVAIVGMIVAPSDSGANIGAGVFLMAAVATGVPGGTMLSRGREVMTRPRHDPPYPRIG